MHKSVTKIEVLIGTKLSNGNWKMCWNKFEKKKQNCQSYCVKTYVGYNYIAYGIKDHCAHLCDCHNFISFDIYQFWFIVKWTA